ncbi:MAG: T9SS C-terminal target domain-containing protein, partial [Aestuariibaculum sp.]
MSRIKHIVTYFLLSVTVLLNVQCQRNTKTEKQITKADFNFSGRRLAEVHDPLYQSWVVNEATKTENTFGKVTVKLNGNFKSNWVKTGMSAPYYAQLISDGLVTENRLELVISGLKPGEHSLQTFHNTFDKIDNKLVTPIKIYVNNELVQTIQQSNRAFAKIDAATAYMIFNAEENQDVVIRFEGEKGFDISEFVINGFEIDTPNLKKQAHSPQPENADDHVVVEKNLQLKWQSPKETKVHHIYIGKNKEAIKN